MFWLHYGRAPGPGWVSGMRGKSCCELRSGAIALWEVPIACFLVHVFCPWLWCCLMPPLITLPASVNAERHYATFLKRPSVVTCRLVMVAGAGWYHLKQ
ncbi:hypothetical protein BCR43DRAFT_487433 [Syncephalastrum racemosum]|uniref:Uncharacterized protein n=1 Tax=Syncephalastrum racemosum TaxID=13706 RepID=A0A1X2HS77_SYNRA|nr:hypothetical protein BCR43DRAFT_487433 [Syncephalastrum racemosum]